MTLDSRISNPSDMPAPRDGDSNAARASLTAEAYQEMGQQRGRPQDRFHNEGLDPFYHNFELNILDPRSGIPRDWFDLPLSQQLVQNMHDTLPARQPAENHDLNGNFEYSIDLQRGDRRFRSSVSEGRQIDRTAIQLLFVKLEFAQGRDFDTVVKDIADKLNVQQELNRVRELAEKIEDPRTRRGLMLAVLEKGLRDNGESFFNIAKEAVDNLDFHPDTLESRRAKLEEMLRSLRSGNDAQGTDVQASQSVPRPGLSAAEQDELVKLCSTNWTRDELLWNFSRAKNDWSK